mgnify:CR=1 FL=1
MKFRFKFRTIKNTILTLSLFLSIGAIADTPMQPLKKIISNNKIESSTLIYISNRCAGLYLASSEILHGKIREQYLLNSLNVLTASRIMLNKTTDLNLMDSLLSTQKDLEKFKNIYSNLSDKSYMQSGKRVTNMMEEDLFTCKPLVAEIIASLPNELLIRDLPENP